MLAQNFQTAEALGVTDAELDALIKVLGMLEREELRHAIFDVRALFVPVTAPRSQVPWDGLFNMVSWNSCVAECGTVCCIGGAAEIVGSLPRRSLSVRRDNNSALERLFFSVTATPVEMAKITPAQAAIALRSFLSSGEPRWAEAMAA